MSFFVPKSKEGDGKLTKMTERQKRFADEYIISGNAYQSALKAGYSDNYSKGNAVKLLENVSVKSYIEARMQPIKEKGCADAEEVMSVLTSVLRGERKEEVLILNVVTGQVEKHEKKPDNSTVIRAGTEILKRYPITQKLDVNLGAGSELKNILDQLKGDLDE